MKISFLIKESEEYLIDLPQTAQDAEKLIPNWLPRFEKNITDSFIWNLWKKYKIKTIEDDSQGYIHFIDGDKKYIVGYEDFSDSVPKYNYIFRINIFYKKNYSILLIFGANGVGSATLLKKGSDGQFQINNQYGKKPFRIMYYKNGNKRVEIYKPNIFNYNLSYRTINYNEDGTIQDEN